jgi:cyclase
MDIKEVKPNVFFVDAPGAASNVMFLKIGEGVVWIDTTSSVGELQAVLDLAGITPDEVSMLITTHADGDHVGGNSLFTCPKYAHMTTFERMKAAERTEDELPTLTFSEDRMTLTAGEFPIELVHTAGHKPDQTILWLPGPRVLLASDLLFQGCYPYMKGGQVEDWIAALKSLEEFEAEVILPGHGTVSNYADIDMAIEYFETGLAVAREHVRRGDSLEETLKDPAFPRHDDWERETRIETNIEVFYTQSK